MGFFSLLVGAGAILGMLPVAASTVPSTQPVTSCPGNDKLCFSVSIPPSTASAGSGDIFFRIQAPSSYEWASLGQGLEMAGSNIFIIYADAARNNVTLSPRLGVSEVLPLYNNEAKVELLAGSGIANGLMTANVRCSNCASWSGGNMTLDDPNSSWIWAYKSGSELATDSTSASLQVHDDMGTLIFDLTKAVGTSNHANPFVTSSGASTNVSTTSTAGASLSGSGSSGGVSTATLAHGVIMGITMLGMFPCGALLRSVVPQTSIWLHAGVQSLALAATIAAAGLGISIGLSTGKSHSSHALLGIAVTVLMGLQPVWGLTQHAHYRRNGSRGPFGTLHRVIGGVAILLGIVNGGLGLQLSGTLSTSGGNTYILVAAVLGSIYLTIFAAIAFSRRQTVTTSTATKRRVRHKMGESGFHGAGTYATYHHRR